MTAYNKSRHRVYLSLILIILFTDGCEKDEISGNVVSDPNLASELYSKSIDTLTFASCDYIFEINLYRDFFPTIPARKNHPLIAVAYLVNIDSLSVSKDLTIVRLYVINSSLIWITSLKEGNSNIPEFKLERINAEGPEWYTGIYIDAILEVKSIMTMNTYFLISRHQYIERTE
jgi:hypothetical protein